MKLRIILVNNNVINKWRRKILTFKHGFLIPEIMLAFSMMTLFLTSALILSASMQSLHRQAVSELKQVSNSILHIATSTETVSQLYGNDTYKKYLEPLTLLTSDYVTAWGRASCNPRFTFDPNHASTTLIHPQLDFNLANGVVNPTTDIEVRDGIAYLTADSAIAATPDLYIIDMHNPDTPTTLSSLNTGPGLSALEVAGPYIYAANAGTTNQLQIIDIHNRAQPVLISKLKLPLPEASTTAPFATTIFYSKGFIYLGTEKWQGKEFTVIDVRNPTRPLAIGSFETDTLINDIYVRGDYVYVAASNINQIMVLDIHNPTNIIFVGSFSSTGWETQEGRTLSYFEDSLTLGRTTGGFNVIANHEFFIFSTSSLPYIQAGLKNSHDILGGVYGIVERFGYFFLSTRSLHHEFQVWNSDLSSIILNIDLGLSPQAMSCDGQAFYFATGDRKGVGILKFN